MVGPHIISQQGPGGIRWHSVACTCPLSFSGIVMSLPARGKTSALLRSFKKDINFPLLHPPRAEMCATCILRYLKCILHMGM